TTDEPAGTPPTSRKLQKVRGSNSAMPAATPQLRGVSTIDADDGAGGEARRVAHEIQRRPDDFLRFRDSTERVHLASRLLHLRKIPGSADVGHECTGRDGVDPHRRAVRLRVADGDAVE